MPNNSQGKISLDWGAIFDILSIFNVKISKSSGSIQDKNIDNFTQLAREIISQIGKNKYDEILNSDEWYDLYEANLLTFHLVDKAKEDTGLAHDTDISNYNRYKKKIKLQEKFFNTEISEIKIGYGQ